jgi:hypothetical protein
MAKVEDESEEEPSAPPPRFGTPTPSKKRPQAPRPVTPTRGRKRMAIGTPVAARRVSPPRDDESGWSTATQMSATIAALEARLNAKIATVFIACEAAETRMSEKFGELPAELRRAEDRREIHNNALATYLGKKKPGILSSGEGWWQS